MNIIDHGKWRGYVPQQLPEGAPVNALYAKRESDGVDWYAYVHATEEEPNGAFGVNSVVFAADFREFEGCYIVGNVTYDPTQIFPAGFIVQEITDYAGSDPFGDYNNKAYDPVTQTFSEPPAIKVEDPVLKQLDILTARIAKLEAKLGRA